ncbi:MAG: CAP domain-containing protein [Patescibacteria group bacterium]|nr:CAP domain-containing protein [Patescibacteria group bacterium]
MKNKKKKGLKFFVYLILGGFLIKLFVFIFKKRTRETIQVNFKDFYDEEKDEVEELTEGKQSFKKFCHDSSLIFKEYFIPNEENEHKPKILRTKPLVIIIVGLVLIKAVVTGYLFFIYPNHARMTELISCQILELINKDRISDDLPILTINPALNSAALTKAQDMIDYDYFAHKSLNGKMPWDWINRGEYAYLFVGENLAMNFNSAQAAHSALMQSESHKKNILNSKYADIGLAVLSGELNGKNTNILVQLFGFRKAELAIVAQEEKISPTQIPFVTLPINPTVNEESAEEKIFEAADEQAAEQIAPAKTAEDLPAQPEEKVEVMPIEKEQIEVAAVNRHIYTSPNSAIENNKVTQVMTFTVQEDKKIISAVKLVKTSHYIFIVVLAFIALALLVNIFVRISIQHKSVIVQGLLVIVFITSLIFIRLHFLEQIWEKVSIISTF